MFENYDGNRDAYNLKKRSKGLEQTNGEAVNELLDIIGELCPGDVGIILVLARRMKDTAEATVYKERYEWLHGKVQEIAKE